MTRIGFKGIYIEPILKGTKTSTIRNRTFGLVGGEIVNAGCQYHLPPFAQLEVTHVEVLDEAQAQAGRDTYPFGTLYRIHFRLLEAKKKRRRARRPGVSNRQEPSDSVH
jgi:hypothetical protein